MFGALAIFCINLLIQQTYKTFDDPLPNLIGDIILLCFSIAVIVALIIVCVYLTRESKLQVDVYTKDKMYRKKGEEILYEIKYSNINSIKQSYFNMILIFCKEGFIKKGINPENVIRPQMTFTEYYTTKDIRKIVEIISEYDPHILMN